MKRRTRKILSLLLAASMVFTMNTVAFGDEIVAADTGTDEATIETITDAAEEADAGALPEEAADADLADTELVAADADLADAELGDAELATIKEYIDGIAINEDGNPVTKITFKSNGAKKNPVNNIAVIENATNPVSWGNLYATDFIETVIEGSDKDDDYLNNTKKQHVSENNPLATYMTLLDPVDGIPIQFPTIPHLKSGDLRYRYGSIEVAEDVFLLYKYGTNNYNSQLNDCVPQSELIAGYNEFGTEAEDGSELPAIKFSGDLAKLNHDIERGEPLDQAKATQVRYELLRRIGFLPIFIWDGRKVAWDKDGLYDATKSTSDALNVKVALVRYENGTVTEFNGVTVGKVNIDKKAIKQASVGVKTSKVKLSAKYYNTAAGKDENVSIYLDEFPVINTLPTFTISIKIKDKEAKKYLKDINTALKKTAFPFGIIQRPVNVYDPTIDTTSAKGVFVDEYYGDTTKEQHWQKGETDPTAIAGFNIKTNSNVIPASPNEITRDDNTGIQDKIEQEFESGGYRYSDLEGLNVGIKISKFSVKKDKAKATITQVVNVVKKGVRTGSAEVGLKPGKDYDFEKYSLAGEDVFALKFPEGGNYSYMLTDPKDMEDYGTRVPNLYYDLSAFGYVWAFRPSPKEKKAFRFGIVANDDQGFVFSEE